MKTKKEIRAAFWDHLKQVAPELYAKKKPGGQNNQICDVRLAFIDFVDNASRNGEISEKLTQSVTL